MFGIIDSTMRVEETVLAFILRGTAVGFDTISPDDYDFKDLR